MKNLSIFAITTLFAFLFLGTSNALAADLEAVKDGIRDINAKAIPEWVKFTMQSYLNGNISESELLNAFQFLEDRGIMSKSQKAAQLIADLKAENTELKKGFKKLDTDGIVGPKTWPAGDNVPPGSQITPSQTKVIPMSASAAAMCTGERSAPFIPGGQVVQGPISNVQVLVSPPGQSLGNGDPFAGDYYVAGATHTYTNENGKRFLMVPVPQVFGGSDEDSSCWVRVSQTHASGDPDRPLVTGRVYNSGEEIYPDEYGKTSSDTTLKGSKIHENAPADDRPTEEVTFYFNKISSASETVHDLVSNEETSTTGWEEGVAAFTSKNYGSESTASGNKSADTLVVQELLNGFIVAINKEILVIESEVAILEELMDMYTSTSTRSSTQYGESDFDFISRYAEQIDTKILSLQTGLRVLDDKLLTIGDDAQLANIDLQNSLQKQQQTLQTISNTSKMLHDTAKSIIQKIG